MANPPVCAVIVNWNHGALLPGCLERLLAQTYAPLEIVVVDNGSHDRSPEMVASHYPGARLEAFAENRGFCQAFNWGARCTAAEYLLSLNPDVMAGPTFVAEMMRALDRGPRVGMVAPKLLRPPGLGSPGDGPPILDSTGLFIDRRRRPYDRGQGELDHGQYDALPAGAAEGGLHPFGACGAAALYRRTMLDDVALDGEYLDEAFFAYYEDADLAWRARSRGWRCAYAPRAIATHDRGGGDTLRKRGRAPKGAMGPRLALRNRYLVAVKNDAPGFFVADLPRILAAELPRLAYAAVTQPGVLLGLADLVRALPGAWAKRRHVRARRTVDDATIRRWFVAPEVMAAGP